MCSGCIKIHNPISCSLHVAHLSFPPVFLGSLFISTFLSTVASLCDNYHKTVYLKRRVYVFAFATSPSLFKIAYWAARKQVGYYSNRLSGVFGSLPSTDIKDVTPAAFYWMYKTRQPLLTFQSPIHQHDSASKCRLIVGINLHFQRHQISSLKHA